MLAYYIVIDKVLSQFLKENLDPKLPVVLALSGGPDSVCLFHLLKRMKYDLHIAHVDHGWRKSSSFEATEVKRWCKENGLPCRLLVLKKKLKGNLEAACREERYKFFKEIVDDIGAQAVILGHQADDQAETVLKRVLEGANWNKMKGMQQVSSMDGLTLWRPLLQVKKEQILQWLEERNLTYFDDESNRDDTFLRAKMRQTLGKEVIAPLNRVACQMEVLDSYFEKRLERYCQVKKTIVGDLLDLSEACPTEPIEIQYLIQKVLPLKPTRDQLETLAQLILENASNKRPILGSELCYLDRRRLFWGVSEIFLTDERIPITDKAQFGPWKIQLTSQEQKQTNWKDSLGGYCFACLPEGEYSLGLAQSNQLFPGGSPIRDWWNRHKIPTLLWRTVPVIYRGDEIYHEFLTGRTYENKSCNILVALIS